MDLWWCENKHKNLHHIFDDDNDDYLLNARDLFTMNKNLYTDKNNQKIIYWYKDLDPNKCFNTFDQFFFLEIIKTIYHCHDLIKL